MASRRSSVARPAPLINPSITLGHITSSATGDSPYINTPPMRALRPLPPVTPAHAAPSLDVSPLPARCETSRGSHSPGPEPDLRWARGR